MKLNTNSTIFITLKLYLSAILLFTILRLILFFTQLDNINFKDTEISTILYVFLVGLRFDVVTSGYLFFLPTTIWFVLDCFGLNIRLVNKFLFWLIFICSTVTIILCVSDIPYFNTFFNRISSVIFNWAGTPGFVLKMIVFEKSYYIYFLIAGISIFLCYKTFKRIVFSRTILVLKLSKKIPLYIAVLLLMFIGIRSKIFHRPIGIANAYFCNDATLNQLGLNAFFSFFESFTEKYNYKEVSLIDSKKALQNVNNYLGIKEPIHNSSIARYIVADSTKQSNKYNVVLVLMERMSAFNLARNGNTENITPFLDSLANHSIYFENCFSSGKNTNQGIFASINSLQPLYNQQLLTKNIRSNGIAYTLKKHKYQTAFFCPHYGEFDALNRFTLSNNFQQFYSEKDYPSREIKNYYGIPDDYLFRFAIPKINEYYKNRDPFFVTLLTVSNHEPFYLPNYFAPHSSKMSKKMVEYADWSLKQFLKQASKQEWFKNTIFVFVADHGYPANVNYDIPLSYYHIPLIFYAPYILKEPKIINDISSQIDIFPTIMGMLNLPYLNNNLGVDLFKEKRPYAILNSYDKAAVIDKEFFMIFKYDQPSELYKYRNRDKRKYASQYPEKVLEMETYF